MYLLELKGRIGQDKMKRRYTKMCPNIAYFQISNRPGVHSKKKKAGEGLMEFFLKNRGMLISSFLWNKLTDKW